MADQKTKDDEKPDTPEADQDTAPMMNDDAPQNTVAAPRNTLKFPRRLLPAESLVVNWHHTTEFGVTPEEVMAPDYWGGVAKQLRPGHEITVNSADMSWYAKLLVRAVGKAEAHVGLIAATNFKTKATAKVTSDFKVEWMGPTKKYGVIRKSDNEPVKDGFFEEAHAHTWIKSHEAALAA